MARKIKMTEEETKMLIDKLKAIEGKEQNYKSLCASLCLPEKNGCSKAAQLHNLQLFCDIEKNGTKYTVTEVFDEAVLPMRSKFQEYVQYMLYKLFEKKENDTVYITNTQLMLHMGIVNDNYVVMRNDNLRYMLENAVDESYEDMYVASITAGKVLSRWIHREMDYLNDAGVITVRPGFCLVEQTWVNDMLVKRIVNVPMNSDLERLVLKAFKDAADDCDINQWRRYIPNDKRAEFYDSVEKRIAQETDGKYVSAYQVNVIIAAKGCIAPRLQNVERILNIESQSKIESTKQIKDDEAIERQKLIEELIATPPTVNYRRMFEVIQ
jgi:hypothetical protein